MIGLTDCVSGAPSKLSLTSLNHTEQQHLTDILDRYLQRVERGESPDPDELLRQHPRWADILRRYLESLGVLHQAVRGIHSAEQPVSFPTRLAHDRVLGDYEIRRQIGRGGMGIVYEARQISLDRRVALKVLPFAAVLDERQIARFRREAQAAAQLHHPHVVPVFGVGCENGVHFYSMQLVDGQSIDHVLGEIGADQGSALRTISMSPRGTTQRMAPVDETSATLANESRVQAARVDSPSSKRTEHSASECSTTSISTDGCIDSRHYIQRVAELGIQAARGLQHAHDYGVVHRDVKPSNLMLDRDGKLWVTDFGLAHIQSEADNMTATGDLIGTLRYMSPEQAAGSMLIDQRTDIYSLGITLYEMLTLSRAIPTKERAQLLRDIELLEPKRPRKLNPAVPKDLETIILKATAKDREQRYLHAQDLADDLQRYLDGKPTLARRPTLIDLGTKWAFRHRTVVATCVLMMVLALFGTSYSLFRIRQEQSNTAAAAKRAEDRQAQAISAIEQITMLARELSRQPKIKREIQVVARDLYRQFVATNQGMPFIEFAQTQNRFGSLSMELGDFDVAIKSYREAATTYRQLTTHSSMQRIQEASNLNDLGYALARSGAMEDAQAAYQDALDTLAKLDQSEEVVIRRTALVVGNLGLLAIKSGNPKIAVEQLSSAIAIRTKIQTANPADIDNRIRLASIYHNLSELYIESDLPRAQTLCEHAVALRAEVVAERPQDIESRVELALSCNNLGSIALRQGHLDLAESQYRLAVQTGFMLARQAPDLPQLRHDLAISLNNLAKAQASSGRWDESLANYEKASAQFESLLPQFEQDAVTLARYGGTLFNQAVVLTKQREPDIHRAAELFDRAIQTQRRSVQVAPGAAQYVSLLRLSLRKYQQLLAQVDDRPKWINVERELADLETSGDYHAH